MPPRPAPCTEWQWQRSVTTQVSNCCQGCSTDQEQGAQAQGVSVEMEVCWMRFSAAAAAAWGRGLQRHSRGGHQEPRNFIGGKPIWQCHISDCRPSTLQAHVLSPWPAKAERWVHGRPEAQDKLGWKIIWRAKNLGNTCHRPCWDGLSRLYLGTPSSTLLASVHENLQLTWRQHSRKEVHDFHHAFSISRFAGRLKQGERRRQILSNGPCCLGDQRLHKYFQSKTKLSTQNPSSTTFRDIYFPLLFLLPRSKLSDGK